MKIIGFHSQAQCFRSSWIMWIIGVNGAECVHFGTESIILAAVVTDDTSASVASYLLPLERKFTPTDNTHYNFSLRTFTTEPN